MHSAPTSRAWRLTLLGAALLASPAASTAGAQDRSVYVPAKDGTLLAVDVHLPAERAEGEHFPALFELTRYWRSRENARTGQPQSSLSRLDRLLLDARYALVKVDVRGSGASFGTRLSEYGRQEVRDGWDVVEWAVRQPWCDGAVGAYGVSYTGTTAELLTATGHPAVRAVVMGWSDFDMYRSPARPYGLYAAGFIDEWGQYVGWLDSNDSARIGASVRRVDGDEDGALLRQAIAEHAGNLDVGPAVRAATFRDSRIGAGDSFAETSALYWQEAIEESSAAMLVFASWFDAGTAEGALARFRNFSNPQNLMILASAHGGFAHASPYVVGRNVLPPRPTLQEQLVMQREFFDHTLKGHANGVEDWAPIRYYNLGEEAFRETKSWPPEGVRRVRFHLDEEGWLSREPVESSGSDEYRVDFGVSTGSSNRWHTQMGRPVLALDDREEMDERMLVYTSAPLEHDLQLTGAPVVHLRLAADREDCAVLAYLEDVAPDGRSRYLGEGGLRAIHRKPGLEPGLDDGLPEHTFAEGDRMPLVPGEPCEFTFRLHPLSVRIQTGHSLRLALAGADAETFARVPAEGDVTLTVLRSAESPSYLELPVLE